MQSRFDMELVLFNPVETNGLLGLLALLIIPILGIVLCIIVSTKSKCYDVVK